MEFILYVKIVKVLVQQERLVFVPPFDPWICQMNKLKITLLVFLSMCIGIVIGGYLFSQSQPRSFLSINHCKNCLSPADLAGLLASVGIQKFPGLIPSVVLETDKTIVIKPPFDDEATHYVIIPKKDIKNIGEISEADLPYLNDVFFVARRIIEKKKLVRYRLSTNGPGQQDVTYLHFHLWSGEQQDLHQRTSHHNQRLMCFIARFIWFQIRYFENLQMMCFEAKSECHSIIAQQINESFYSCDGFYLMYF